MPTASQHIDVANSLPFPNLQQRELTKLCDRRSNGVSELQTVFGNQIAFLTSEKDAQ